MRGRLFFWAVLLAVAAIAAPTGSAAPRPLTFPAAGEIVWERISARKAPRANAKVVKVLRQFRPDYRLQIVHAVGARKDRTGRLWYKLSLPMRPYGTTGWVRSEGVALRPIAERIVVDRSARVLTVYRGRRVIFRTRVAVGRADRPTPLGYFYVAAKFRPRPTAFVSAYAFELSAPAGLSDFPGGGVIGIHGTPAAWSIGRAASNGCMRVRNAAARRLKNLVPLGTPVRISR